MEAEFSERLLNFVDDESAIKNLDKISGPPSSIDSRFAKFGSTLRYVGRRCRLTWDFRLSAHRAFEILSDHSSINHYLLEVTQSCRRLAISSLGLSGFGAINMGRVIFPP